MNLLFNGSVNQALDNLSINFTDLIGTKREELLITSYEMRKLLHHVNEATGPGANEQALPDALKAVSDYLDNLPR